MSLRAAVRSPYPTLVAEAKRIISFALFVEGENVTQAAKRLHIDVRTLFRLVAEFPDLRGDNFGHIDITINPLDLEAAESGDNLRHLKLTKNVKTYGHQAVSRAVQLGILIRRPCEICGEKRAVAHHDDYAKPLDIRWLCYPHHSEWHRANGPGINGANRQ